MALSDNLELRATTWPDGRLPHPPIWPREHQLTDVSVPGIGGRPQIVRTISVIQSQDEAATPDEEPEGEIYLKLRQIDLDDDAAILEFANRYGPLGARAADFAGISEIEGTRTSQQLARLRQVAAAVEQSDPHAESLMEFRFAADWLYDLTNLWLVVKGTEPQGLDWRILTEPSSNFTAHQWLSRGMSTALTPFHPRVMTRYAKDYRGHPTTAERSAQIELMGTPLFSICALELFNHIAEDADYRVCSNDRCGRFFVRQEGRSRVGQHRVHGALLYCSNRCRSAEGMRKSRAKRSTQPPREGGKDA